MAYTINFTVSGNNPLSYQSSLVVPVTATPSNFTSSSAVTISPLAIVVSGLDSFTATTDLTTTTLTAGSKTFNVTIQNPNVPWGNVLDTVFFGVSTVGSSAVDVMQTVFSTGQVLSSIGIWTSQAEQARNYVEGTF